MVTLPKQVLDSLPEHERKRITGLGDIVAIAANPIAKAIDAALGTEIQSCGGCASRRERLNKAFPINPK